LADRKAAHHTSGQAGRLALRGDYAPCSCTSPRIATPAVFPVYAALPDRYTSAPCNHGPPEAGEIVSSSRDESYSASHDKHFFDTFMLVLGGLVALPSPSISLPG